MNTGIIRNWTTNKLRFLLLPTLLVIFLFLALTTSIRTSPICDEVAHHVASGYSYVKTLDFRMNPSVPPLIREFMGVPLLFLNLRLPVDHVSWQTIDSPVFGRLFYYDYNTNAGDIVFWSRFPIILLSMALAFLVFFWAQKIYGFNAGVFALFLYVFSPAVLGSSAIAMTDIGGSFFMFLAVFQYWRFLRCKEKLLLNLILSGVCFGLAQSSKITAVVLYPLFFVLSLSKLREVSGNRVRELLRQAGFLLLIFFIGLLVLWMTYAFEFKPLLENAPDPEEKIQYIKHFFSLVPLLDRPWIVNKCIYFAKEVPIPLSTYIVTFLGMFNQVVKGGQMLYFFGQYYNKGVPVYYLVNYLIKTPLVVIFLIIASIIFSCLRKRSKIDIQTNMFLLLPLLTVFVGASFSRLQGGVRYILPAYPFLFVWLSDTVNIRVKSNAMALILRSVFVLLLIWYGLTALIIRPFYLGYFNELVGGIKGKGYKITHDSDWGQDLPSLAEYLKENNIDQVKLAYFGTADPGYYGIKHLELDDLDRKEPRDYVYAISLRRLVEAEWANDYEPVDIIGGSIFVYDFRSKDSDSD